MFALTFGVSSTAQSWISTLWFVVAFFAIFYFLIIMPRKRQEKKHNELLEGLASRDKVVTIGGLCGEVKKVKEKTVMLKVAENVEIEVLKTAVAYKRDEE